MRPLGWGANLGKGDTKDNLLGGVVDLVVKLLSSNPGQRPSLLSLAGVNPSYILGCQINAPLKLEGVDYVGGIYRKEAMEPILLLPVQII